MKSVCFSVYIRKFPRIVEFMVCYCFSVYTGSRTRIVGDPQSGNVGRLQVYQYGWWASVCKVGWGQIGAQVNSVHYSILNNYTQLYRCLDS